MKKIIVNLSDAKPGDWIEAEYIDSYDKPHPFEGKAWEHAASGALYVGGMRVCYSNGIPTEGVQVNHITRDVKPLPTEPGVNFYATVRGVENVQVVVDQSWGIEKCFYSPRPINGTQVHDASLIDPDTVRIAYTPGQEAGQ